jgi:small ribosomal subunit Rsm22
VLSPVLFHGVEPTRDEPEAFERAVLSALGVEPSDAALARWAEVYSHVSSVLTREAAAGRFDAPSSAIETPQSRAWTEVDFDAVWGLVYAARTHAIARRLLDAYPAQAGAFAEIGAGWGPFGLAAARAGGTEVHLVELSASRLARAARLFAAMGMPEPRTHPEDAVQSASIDRSIGGRSLSAIALPYSLGEMAGVDDDGTRMLALVARWIDALAPGGRLYVLEPGTKPSARRVQALRDRLAPTVRIIAPCCGAPACPLLADPRDWCHFTWSLPLGPIGRAIAEQAHRRWHEVHFSWLVIERSAPSDGGSRADGSARLLEIRRIERGKVTARFCDAEGLATVTALRREREAFARVVGLEPGARVHLDRARLEAHGDGLRLGPSGGLEGARGL